jgi:predicted transcriptional regulator
VEAPFDGEITVVVDRGESLSVIEGHAVGRRQPEVALAVLDLVSHRIVGQAVRRREREEALAVETHEARAHRREPEVAVARLERSAWVLPESGREGRRLRARAAQVLRSLRGGFGATGRAAAEECQGEQESERCVVPVHGQRLRRDASNGVTAVYRASASIG